MANGTRRRWRERGQATVELALTLPVVVLFALIVAQAGIVARDQLLVTHAAREGARAAAVAPTAAQARAGALAGAALDPSRSMVTLSGGTSSGDALTVVVTYRSPTTVPIVGRLIGDVTVRGQVTMRVE